VRRRARRNASLTRTCWGPLDLQVQIQQIFVTTLGASNYTYAMAMLNLKSRESMCKLQSNPALMRASNGEAAWLASSISAPPLLAA
jgi:hypothetical protein